MTTAALKRRLKKVEKAKKSPEFTLGELIWWSYHTDRRIPGDPFYEAANRRFMASTFCRLMSNTRPVVAL